MNGKLPYAHLLLTRMILLSDFAGPIGQGRISLPDRPQQGAH